MARVVIVKISGALSGFITAIVFIILVLFTIAPVLFARGGIVGQAFIIIVVSILILRLLHGIYKYRRINSIVDRLSKLVIVRDNVIRFNKPVEYVTGTFKCVGLWLGFYRSYRTRYLLEQSSKRPVLTERIKIDELPAEYTLLINDDREGYIEAPVIKILDPEYSGGLILVARRPREVSASLEKNSLRASYGVSFAEASLSVDKGLLKTSLYKYPVAKNKARLEIIGYIAAGNKMIYAVKSLCETTTQRNQCQEKLLMDEDIIIIGHEKTINPWNISQALKLKPIIAGYSRGDYIIRLVFETTLKTIIDSAKLVIKQK